jgi:hypothetical protein
LFGGLVGCSIITAHDGSMIAANGSGGRCAFPVHASGRSGIFLKPAIKPATEPANPGNFFDQSVR